MEELHQKAAYLYCVVRTCPLDQPPVTGIETTIPVCFEPLEDFVAVYSMVALDMFVGAAAEERMKDVAWIGPRALRHDQVIVSMMKESAVYPARFATMFSSLESLRKNLRLNARLISDFLDHTDHTCEYSVKGFVNRKDISEFLIRTTFKDEKKRLDALSPGKKYLAERQYTKKIENETREWIKKTSGALLDCLTEKYREFSPRKIFTEKTDKNETEMVFNCAFLLHKNDETSFLEETAREKERLAPTGLSLALSGPWPPYSFCKTTPGEGL